MSVRPPIGGTVAAGNEGDLAIAAEYVTPDAINFMASPVTDEEIAHIKALYESWTYSLHPAAELINSDRPRLRAMVERMVELGFGPPAPPVPFE